jgi:hypothetical protein
MATEHNMDLEGLSDVEATVHFTDPDELSKTLDTFLHDARARDSLSDHTVLITGFPIDIFTTDDDEPSPVLQKYKTLYDISREQLLLTMQGPPHEIVSRRFDWLLQNKLDNMNCDIAPRGGVKTSMSNVVKAPDCAWGPLKLDDYSTCVLEARVSESSRGLARDAKIWLEHRESHVTQVVTVKISRTRPEMVFLVSKQGEEERETRAHHPTRAIVDQEIRITLEDGRPLADG